MKKVKLMIFLPNLIGGGAEKVTVNIIRMLDTNYYDIHLVLVKEYGDYLNLIPNYIKVHNLNAKKTFLSILLLRNIIKQVEPDVIFSTLFRTHIALYLSLLFKKHKLKIILRSPNSPKLLIENGKMGAIQRYFLEKAYQYAHVVIAQTPEMKIELCEYHNVSSQKVIVLLNPVDTKLIDEKLKYIANPFNNEYINVVAAGRLTEQKGFDILIKSFKEVIRKNNTFRLFIIGQEDSGGMKSILLDLVQEYKLDKYIKFLGFKENPYQYFFYSDLYVLSSRWEGLPNTVLENLYLKKPIVATKCIPYMNTLIDNGKNGFIVDIEDPYSLSEAILNFKKINSNHKTVKFDNSELNKIFKPNV